MSSPKLFVEHTRSEEELSGLVDENELRTAMSFGSARRRREYLSWRGIVRRELGADTIIEYADSGAPCAVNRQEHIGVSHSDDMVAVIISERPCAIDIEKTSRDFSRAASRFMTERERTLSDDSRLPAAVWCAKETLYKYAGHKGLSLLDDLAVRSVDFENGSILGEIKGYGEVRLSVLESGEFLIVYVG